MQIIFLHRHLLMGHKRSSMRTEARQDVSIAVEDQISAASSAQTHIRPPAIMPPSVGISAVLPLEDVTNPQRNTINRGSICNTNFWIMQKGNSAYCGAYLLTMCSFWYFKRIGGFFKIPIAQFMFTWLAKYL